MFTLSNLITSVRIFLLPPIAFAILKENMNIALILIIISYFTDIIDGIVARKLNQETELGKIIDPLTDKITLVVVLICLTIIDRFPEWAMLIMVCREIIIMTAGLYLVVRRLSVIQSSFIGKVTGWVFGTMVIVYIINLDILFKVTLYAALFFMVISLISYGRQFRIITKQEHEDK